MASAWSNRATAMARLTVAAALALAVLLVALGARAEAQRSSTVVVATLDGSVDELSARYLGRTLRHAAAGGAPAVLIEVNTPGGRVDSMRSIVQAILASPVPVITYVTPTGAHAGSAGTLVVAAGDIAAMTPATNIGAAAPVGAGGTDLPGTLKGKVVEDTAALARAIAERRGRDAAALQRTITEAKAYTAEEAKAASIIDIVAPDRQALLAAADGRTVNTAAGPVTLRLAGASVEEQPRTWTERALGALSDPNIVAIMLAVGALGIWAEFMVPGVGPGIVGLFLYGLAFAALGVLPTNWVAAGMVLAGLVLVGVEIYAPGWHFFGMAGGVLFAVGLFFLFGDFAGGNPLEPAIYVSRILIGAIVVACGGAFALLWAALREGGAPTGYSGGREPAIVGATGLVLTGGGGLTVAVAGAEYPATAAPPGDSLSPGDEVRVVGQYGGALKVERARPEAARGLWVRLALRMRRR